MASEIEKLERYIVKGGWVAEPFVNFGIAEMVLAEVALARENALLEALKETITFNAEWTHENAQDVIRRIEESQ